MSGARRIALAAGAAFLLMLLLVVTGATAPFDTHLLPALRLAKVAPTPAIAEWDAAVRHFTALGSLEFRAPVAILGALLLFLSGRRRLALVLLVGCAGESLLVEVVKALVERQRPDLLLQVVRAKQTSFPSGHAAGAMFLYPLTGLFLGGLFGRGGARTGAAIGILLAILIGLSRLLLGVHWPSDVLAGWLLGGAIALVGAGALRGPR